MGRCRDLVASQFGKLVVRSRAGSNSRKEALWLCDCECGNAHVAKSRNLLEGKVRSCGCLGTGVPRDDSVVGRTFRDLTVLSHAGRSKSRESLYLCRCVCGNEVVVFRKHLGRNVGCGCVVSRRRRVRTEEELASRTCPQYATWARRVKRRAKRRCEVCLVEGVKMTSHHLDSFADCRESRYDLDNGVCLCEECHHDFHGKYGYQHNRKWQFEEYAQGRSGVGAT